MKRGLIIIISGIITTATIVAILVWSGYTFYRLEQRTLAEKTEGIIQEIAAITQESNRTLNNLLASYNDKDGSEKQAFAIGMNGNIGRMKINFKEDQDTTINEPANDGVFNITKDTLEKMGITFIPDKVNGISYFDSLLRDSITLSGIKVNYAVIPQKTADEFAFINDSSKSDYTYHSRPFIINYYQPDVYRVNYTISKSSVVGNMWHFVLAALFLLILVPAAFIMYYRAYLLQAQSARFKETLFSNITHELKTPLTSLQLIIDSIQGDSKHPGYVEKLSFATTELNRMKLIVDKILSYGKLNREEFALNAEIVDINNVIEEAIGAMKIVSEQSNAVINYQPERPLKTAGDRTLLINMLTSLIDNSIKYNRTQPIINISAVNAGDNIVIRLTDNGIGIAQEYQKKIFEPFFRIPTGDVHNTKGNGIGLSFVAQIARLHGGDITVSSNPEEGVTFTITLPL